MISTWRFYDTLLPSDLIKLIFIQPVVAAERLDALAHDRVTSLWPPERNLQLPIPTRLGTDLTLTVLDDLDSASKVFPIVDSRQ